MERGLRNKVAQRDVLWLLVATGVSFMISSKHEQRTRQLTTAEITECEKADPKPIYCIASRRETVTIWLLPPWPMLAGVASVPILLFVLGAAGYWVAKGFKAAS